MTEARYVVRPTEPLPEPSTTPAYPCGTHNLCSDDSHSVLLATTADRRLNILDVPSCTLRASETTWHGSPILCCTALSRKLLLTTSMNGDVLLSDLTGKVMDRRRDHLKYVVRVAVHHTDSDTWVATAGWDSKVHLYRLPSASSNGSPALGAPVSTIPLTSNPESLLFLTHPDTSEPVLLLTRRDSTFLHYYSVPSAQLLGRQNLAPHSNAWIAFTPSAIAPCPTDSSLLAVATSAVPHMKLIIVRLLFPSPDSTSSEQTALAAPSEVPTAPPSLLDGGPSPATIQARAALALQDREAAAIQIHCTTLAPQTHYSTPALAWRPDGSGVWVNGDDGAVRGIETASGKIVATLKGGHEGGSKVRCLWAGSVPIDGSEGEREEWLVSGGFDQKLIVWKPE